MLTAGWIAEEKITEELGFGTDATAGIQKSLRCGRARDAGFLLRVLLARSLGCGGDVVAWGVGIEGEDDGDLMDGADAGTSLHVEDVMLMMNHGMASTM